ncbi:hypothetical protein Bca52824_092918 [Brassica carinata]|uniref:Uncharacterized protein n=1 Tax=Brassica carinata TaxID=52824 RepID=A0A8X7P6S6_BRACI|nr:hypothetical protein Bca52824_092918 [Brassica carinata]
MKVFRMLIQLKIKNVLIIAGDSDFGNLLRKFFKKKSLNVMLAYPERGVRILNLRDTHFQMDY